MPCPTSLPPAVEQVLEALVLDTTQQEARALAEQALADGDDPLLAVALDLARFKFRMCAFTDIPSQVDAAATKKRNAQERHAAIREQAEQLRAANPRLSVASVATILAGQGRASARSIRRILAKK